MRLTERSLHADSLQARKTMLLSPGRMNTVVKLTLLPLAGAPTSASHAREVTCPVIDALQVTVCPLTGAVGVQLSAIMVGGTGTATFTVIDLLAHAPALQASKLIVLSPVVAKLVGKPTPVPPGEVTPDPEADHVRLVTLPVMDAVQ